MLSLEIRSWRDLEKFGFDALTGEACNLNMRMLVDLSQEAADTLRIALGMPPDSRLMENRNNAKGSVASALIPHDLIPTLGMLCLIREGYKVCVVSAYGSVVGFKEELCDDFTIDQYISRWRIKHPDHIMGQSRWIARTAFDFRPRAETPSVDETPSVIETPSVDETPKVIAVSAESTVTASDLASSVTDEDVKLISELLAPIKVPADKIQEWWESLKSGDKFTITKDHGINGGKPRAFVLVSLCKGETKGILSHYWFCRALSSSSGSSFYINYPGEGDEITLTQDGFTVAEQFNGKTLTTVFKRIEDAKE